MTDSLREVGQTTVSVQRRCPQMSKHDSTPPLPIPCEYCYSLIVTAVKVPYLPQMRHTVVVGGAE